jgi:hypothetical protein
MNIPPNTPKSTEKKDSQTEELKTDPVSEKDEVKEAERRTAKLLKKAAEKKK